jgi:hypothetical protein
MVTRLNNELYILIASVVGMISITVAICMGHNSILIDTLAGLNVVGLGAGVTKVLKGRRKGHGEKQKEKE